MIDDHDLLERALRRFEPDQGLAERVMRRRDRKRRNQRIRAGVTGGAIGIVVVMAAIRAGDDGTGTRPVIQPTPTLGPAVTTDTAPWFDRNVDTMCGQYPGAWCGADYQLDLGTGAMTPLPESIVLNGQNGYAISPDGSEVAYYRTRLHYDRHDHVEDGTKGLFVANLDGTRVRLVAPDAQPTLCCPRQGSPGWSPDGTKIAYVGRSDGDRNSNIFVVDLTSGETSQATFETVPVSGTQFSPDGSSIVYLAHQPDGMGGGEVRIVPATGGEGSTLVESGDRSDASDASLSPDGSLLSYTCGRWLSWALCLANADASDPREIVTGRDSFGIPTASWSPDGSRIAYWTFHRWDVFVLDVATGERTLVGKGAWPSWLDDDTLIVEIYYGPA